MSKVYTPSGLMCTVCKHAYENCGHLPFSTMRPIKVHDDGVVVVKCTNFEANKNGSN